MIGIYKITNPKKHIYIGQSVEIEKRFKRYQNLHCKTQIKLLASFLKHGVENHIFEVLELCESYELNNRESFYITEYNSCYKGLNCLLGGNGHTDETKRKIGLANSGTKHCLGKIHSKETKKKISDVKKGIKREKFSHQWIENMRKSLIGRKHSEETIKKMRDAQSKRDNSIYNGKYPTKLIQAAKLNSIKQKGIPRTEQEKINIKNGMPKNPVIDIATGKIYETIKTCALELNINKSTLSGWLNKSNNPSTIRYLKSQHAVTNPG